MIQPIIAVLGFVLGVVLLGIIVMWLVVTGGDNVDEWYDDF